MAHVFLPVAEVALLPNKAFIVVGAVEDEWEEIDGPDDSPAVWDERFVLVSVAAQEGQVRVRLWDIEPAEQVRGRPLVFDGRLRLTDGSLRIGEPVGPASLRYRLVAPGESIRLRIWTDGRRFPFGLDLFFWF